MPDYTNSGVLFINDRKQNDKQPDLTGKIEIDDDLLGELVLMSRQKQPITMEVSAWNRKSAKGNRFLSLAVKKPWKRDEGQTSHKPRTSTDDDDLPF